MIDNLELPEVSSAIGTLVKIVEKSYNAKSDNEEKKSWKVIISPNTGGSLILTSFFDPTSEELGEGAALAVEYEERSQFTGYANESGDGLIAHTTRGLILSQIYSI